MFPIQALQMRNSDGGPSIDGTQGSANAGILAAVYFTVSGTTPTIVGQKNVASITRNAQGKYRITFTSALANNNYGLIANGRWADAAASDDTPLICPTRNSTGGFNTYSTSSVDVSITNQQGIFFDPEVVGVVIFDPASVGSDYLAACSVTVSGTTPTVQRQTNVSSSPRQATGVYRPTFTSALSSADYSVFGSSRYADFTNDSSAFFGQNRATSQTTAMTELSVGTLAAAGSLQNFEPGRFSMLARNSDTFPRGTVAGVRFSVSGSTCTILKSWNVASVTRSGTGLFRITFSTQISDTSYIVLGSGKLPATGVNEAPLVGMNRNTTLGNNRRSRTAVDIVTEIRGNVAGAIVDPEIVDVWVVKPWLM